MDFASEYESLPTNDVITHMMAGSMAGIGEHCVMYPFDCVKTRMQSIQPSPQATYRTIPEALYKIVRYEGALRPMRGMSAVITGAGPAHAMYYSCYEQMKHFLSFYLHGHNQLAYGISGCVATLLHDAVMNPVEVIKQRMQMYNSPFRTCRECFRTVLHTEGLKAFYRSYTTQLTMNVPYQSLHFMMYEFMQEVTNAERYYDPKAHMVSGAAAGAFAAAMTTPLDVCKTLLNTQENQTLKRTQQPRITGLFNAVQTIYRIRGIRGYFRGMQARVLFQMPSTAIAWSVYEFFKYSLKLKRAEDEDSEECNDRHNSNYPPSVSAKSSMMPDFPVPAVTVAAASSVDERFV